MIVRCSWLTLNLFLSTVCAVLALSFSASVRAELQPSHAEVPVVIVADADEAAKLEEVLGELFAQLGIAAKPAHALRVDVRDVIEPPAQGEPDPPLARAWVDLSGPRYATVYLVDQRWERILIRHVPLGDTPEVVRETVGRILSTSLEALLAGGLIGVERRHVEQQLARRALVESPPRARGAPLRVSLRGDLLYEATPYGSISDWIHGPGARLAANLADSALRPGLALHAQYRLPLTIAPHPIGMRVNSVALRVLGEIGAPLSRRLTWWTSAGAGADWIHFEPRASGAPGYWTAAGRSMTVAILRAELGGRLTLAPNVSLLAGLALELDLSRTRYVVVLDSSTHEVFRPWAARPGLLLGLSVP